MSLETLSNKEIEYKPIGEITEGDILLTDDNEETVVKHAYEHHVPESMYQMTFANGETFKVSGNHLWYTVNSLDRSTHKERIRKAVRLSERMSGRKMSWLYKMADADEGIAPEVDLNFFLEVLEVPYEDNELVWQVRRICESIGPVVMQKATMIDVDAPDKNILSPTDTPERPLYSAKMFAQQMIALVSTSLKLDYHKYELLKGKVRTTTEIAETHDLRHDFPSAPAV